MKSAIRRLRIQVLLLLLFVVATSAFVLLTSACDDHTGNGMQFALPSYTQHVGEKGKDPNGKYSPSEGLSYTLSLLEPQHYTISGIGTCTDVDIVIPDTYRNIPVTGIESNAFRHNDRLLSVMMGDTITTIGESAFAGCKRLLSVTLGANVGSIGKNAFAGCFRLMEVGNYSTLDIRYASTDNGLIGFFATNIFTADSGHTKLFVDEPFVYYQDEGTNTLVGSLSPQTELVVPASVTAVGDYAFCEDDSLQYVVLGDSVTNIGRCAFKSCRNLQSVHIGDGVIGIEEEAFYRCQGLTHALFGEHITFVGRLAFSGCDLRELRLPHNIYTLGEYAFADNRNLSTAQLSKNITELDSTVFAGCNDLQTFRFSSFNNWYRTQSTYEFENRTGGLPVDVRVNEESNAAAVRSGKYFWYKQ